MYFDSYNYKYIKVNVKEKQLEKHLFWQSDSPLIHYLEHWILHIEILFYNLTAVICTYVFWQRSYDLTAIKKLF